MVVISEQDVDLILISACASKVEGDTCMGILPKAVHQTTVQCREPHKVVHAPKKKSILQTSNAKTQNSLESNEPFNN